MTGIICVYPFGLGRENWKISRFIYYGLLALQHRGSEVSSIVTFDKEFKIISGKGSVNEVFNEENMMTLSGFIGAGFVSSQENDIPIIITSPKQLVLLYDGMPDLDKDRKTAWHTLAEMLSEEIDRVGDSLDATFNVLNDINGSYSFIALTEDHEAIIARDRHGIKPLELGSLGFDLGSVASETSALDVLGMEHVSTVNPGEIIRFDPHSIERRELTHKKEYRYCSFEYLYLARPDSIINGISVYKVREKIGEILAEEKLIKADIVIGIPETAIPFSIGYSKVSKINVSLGFITTGHRIRTALKPTLLERLIGVQLKLNPIKDAVDGKDVILIDDSVVRGTTLRNTVWNLKRKGAHRIHVLIGSPPLCSSCPYGENIPPPDELIARYLSEEEIAEIIGADTFHFLTLDGLIKSIGLPSNMLCLSCWMRR
jgi:amidophosphoribosyltransferase